MSRKHDPRADRRRKARRRRRNERWERRRFASWVELTRELQPALLALRRANEALASMAPWVQHWAETGGPFA